MIDMNKTTWQDMLKDKYIYSNAVKLIAIEPSIKYLLDYKILHAYSVAWNTNHINKTDNYLFGGGAPEIVVSNIILKLRDRNVTYFDSPANKITLTDLAIYVCAVLSKYIMIDKLIRQHLFVWNTAKNEKTFSLFSLLHYQDLKISTGYDDLVELQYKIIDNKNIQAPTKFEWYAVKLTTTDIFDFDYHIKMGMKEFIDKSLNNFEVNFEINYFEGPNSPVKVNTTTCKLKELGGRLQRTLISEYHFKNMP